MEKLINIPSADLLASDNILSLDEIGKLYREVKSRGWDNGLTWFLSGISLEKALFISRLISERQSGWKFLLKLEGIGRALILDSTIGAITEAIAPHCSQVYCLHPDKLILECIKERLAEKDIRNVNFVQINNPRYLPFQENCFDIAVLHNIERILPFVGIPSWNGKDKFVWLTGEVERVLMPFGSFFFSIQNRFGFHMLWKRLTERKDGYLLGDRRSFCSSRIVYRYLKRSGFHNIKIMYIDPDILNIKELIEPISSKNENKSISLKDCIKKHLVMSKLFTPGFIFIASKKPCKSFIGDLLENEMLDGSALRIEKYIISWIHTIVVARAKVEREGYNGVVVRLPLTDEAYQLCRQNMATITGLKTLGIQIPFNVPNPIKEGIYKGQAYFIEGLINGVAIDSPVTAFYKAFPKAVNILIEFHRMTSGWHLLNNNLFNKIISGYIDGLRGILQYQNLNFNYIIYDLERFLKKKLIGKKFPLVWQHGDFKLENLLIDPEATSINGIIDWDLSEREGLFLIDLLHLLVSRRRVVEKKELMSGFVNIFVPCKFDKTEEEALNDYLNALDIDKEIVPVMIIMYWLHHITKRMKWNYIKKHPNWLESNISAPLNLLHSTYL